MRPSATHDSRYNQLICDKVFRGREVRCEPAYEDSEEEEEEGSSEKYTESDDTGESQQQHRGREWNVLDKVMERPGTQNKVDRPDNFLFHSYYTDIRTAKQDKVTQKNLLSPFPSFLKSPIYREAANSAKYSLPTVPSSREPSRDKTHNSKTLEKIGEGNDTICFHHHHRERYDDKLCDRHKMQSDSQKSRPSFGAEAAARQSKFNMDTDQYSRFSTDLSGGIKRYKSGSRESETGNKCPDCSRVIIIKNENVQRGLKPCESERELQVHDSYMTKTSVEERKPERSDGKVREKLVYVVEEEGKDVAKLETDLFSVNEILTIKKDLLELSEFAKKLKKLKEMKKESDKGKDNSPCPCRPVAEVLVDVNRRIEALEARQEELERGSQKSGKKGDTDYESKQSDFPHSSVATPSKTPVMTNKQSAMTSTPSFPKTEKYNSRAEGFSNNSEIVNELLDIKSQLQRLEKRRKGRDITSEPPPMGDLKVPKKKGHAIAVFSSRTYILTPDNYEKKKEERKLTKIGDKNVIDSMDLIPPKLKSGKNGDLFKMETKTKENVANWLKSIPTVGEDSSNELGVFLATETLESKGRTQQSSQEMTKKDELRLRCKTCAQVMKEEDFASQDQKNRATGKEVEKNELINVLKTKEGFPVSPNPDNRPPLECKECIMTSSGKIYTFTRKASPKTLMSLATATELPRTPVVSAKVSSPVNVRHSVSSSSIPSVIHTKNQIQNALKNRHRKTKSVEEDLTESSMSKSLQELTSTSTTIASKGEKTEINTKKKGCRSPSDKKLKENKNELVKKEIEKILRKNLGLGDSSSSPSTSTTEKSEVKKVIDLEHGGGSLGNKILAQTYSVSTASKSSYKEEKSKGKKEKAEDRKREKEKKKKDSNDKNHKKVCEKCFKYKKEKPKYYNTEKSKRRKSETDDEDEEEEDEEDDEEDDDDEEEDDEEEERRLKRMIFHCVKKKERNPFSSSKEGLMGPMAPMVYSAVQKRRHDDYQFRNNDMLMRRRNPSRKNDSSDFFPVSQQCDTPPQPQCEFEEAEEDDSCFIKNWFKSLRNIGNLTYLNRFGGCERDKKKVQIHKPILEYEEENFNGCPEQSRDPEHFKKCKCVKIFLQSQTQQEWPGVRPFKSLSSESMTETGSYTSDTNTECSETESDRGYFPWRKSEVYYVGRAEESPDRKKKKKCVCDKCGNVHKKKKPKRRKYCNPEKACIQQCKSKCKEANAEPPSPPRKMKFEEPEPPKKFSYFRSFCKPKSVDPQKSKSSVFSKIAEIRHFGKKKQGCGACKCIDGTCVDCRCRNRKNLAMKATTKESTESIKGQDKCFCSPKWEEFETRLLNLECKKNRKKKKREERKKRKKRCNGDDEFSEEKQKIRELCEAEGFKKKQKKMKKKHCCEELCKLRAEIEACEKESSESAKKGKGKKKQENDKMKKKAKGLDECCEDDLKKKVQQTYYCTCLSLDNAGEVFNNQILPKPKRSSKIICIPKDDRIPAPEPVEKKEESKFEKKKNAVKMKISSLSLLFNQLKKQLKQKKEIILPSDEKDPTSDDALLEDVSKSSPMPRERAIKELKEVPTCLKKGKRKKEKKKKECRAPKSKSGLKRHKY